MLVLSRKSGESVRIGDDIKLTIVKIRGNRIRIGIEAPDGVHIVRDELSDWQELSFGPAAPLELPTPGRTCQINNSL